MDSGLRELVALSALAAFGCGLALPQGVRRSFWRRDRLLTSAARLAITPAAGLGDRLFIPQNAIDVAGRTSGVGRRPPRPHRPFFGPTPRGCPPDRSRRTLRVGQSVILVRGRMMLREAPSTLLELSGISAVFS
jgi:hypothetical protein